MQFVIQEFTIGFFDSSGVFSIYAKEDDIGRVLKFHLYDGVQEYDELLSDPDLLITVRVILPDGHILPDVPVDKSGLDTDNKSISIPLTAEMVQQSGVAHCELVFASITDDKIISTTHFNLVIDQAYNGIDPDAKVIFDTWTELYIAIKTLEADITSKEELRVGNENTRVSNENTRVANENERVSNEATRVSNEAGRVSAEAARDTAEQQREAAERIRESRVQEQVDEAHMWADGMNTTEDRPSATNNAKFYALQAQAVSGIFNGIKADWDALPLSEKAKYQTVILTDD